MVDPHEDPPPEPPAPTGTGRTPGTLAALRHPNYRLWLAGQAVSLVGTWMQSMAQGFLAFELTGSSAFLGYIGFASGLPAWLFSLHAGVLADRVPRRRVLLATQSTMMLLALGLAALTLTHLVAPIHLFGFAFLLGTANAIESPARLAFVAEIVAREDLTNAIALNSTVFHTATTIGPSLAGVLYQLLGPGWCFVANGLSFVAVLVALLRMRLEPRPKTAAARPALLELRQGFRFATGHPVIRVLLATLGLVAVFGVGTMALLPAWAVRVLHGGAGTNGLLQSARGLGSFSSALVIATVGGRGARGRLLGLGAIGLPLSLAALALFRSLPLSLVALFGCGAGLILLLNLLNALVQTHVPDDLRGRVMSLYMMVFLGFLPIGALLAGTLAERIGEPWVVASNALALAVFALVLRYGFPAIRRLD
jgi:MFS family permease